VRPVALAYHGVRDVSDAEDPKRLIVSPAHLEAHVRFLQRLGYRFRSAEEVLADGGLRSRTAVLTFDDGFADWPEIAAPLLARLGVRGTFYVCPGLWNGQHPDVPGEAGRLMGEEGVRALLDAGMEIGSHTLSHPDLRSLDDAALDRELRGSKAAVEEIQGRACRTLAYPYGLHDERVRRAAGAAGYELAWAWLPGRWRDLSAPRLPGPPRHGALRLALKLAGVRRRTG
jgi:peptidoglycan/xylan/chitin deacetylase (PgdA/CDA1 family)